MPLAPSDLAPLVANVRDEASLLTLLRDGLDWPILDPERGSRRQPEIADGIRYPGGEVSVRRLRPTSAEDVRPVFLVDFETGTYLRRDLRALLRSVREQERETADVGATGVGDTLYIVAQEDWRDVRFVLFRPRPSGAPEIRSFGWRDGKAGRTVLDINLIRLRWNSVDSWQSAFDVEGLTVDFYKDYMRVFDEIKKRLVSRNAGGDPLPNGPHNEERRHSWTQLLFNRLLFLAFVEKMNWMRVPGKSDGRDYLHDLYVGSRGKSKGFLGVLRCLFDELDMREDDPARGQHADALGTVPYLNGGLFAQDALLEPDFGLDDRDFDLIFGEPNGLFRRYNFTVTESTPADQEVAVDPEMLGKIFERLVNDRHAAGKYYTPRPIVEFMVNEALKGYLVGHGVAADKAALLIEEGKLESASGLAIKATEVPTFRRLLDNVKAVDPACGSGAYLLGLLQKLFEARDLLEILGDEEQQKDPERLAKRNGDLYARKLRIVQKSIYGVDRDETAVGIARLRLWLSLTVENPYGIPPEPLPNLKFRIESGDSLACPVTPIQPDLLRDATIEELVEAKDAHMAAGYRERTRLEHEVERLESVLANDVAHHTELMDLVPDAFDWSVKFAEVFTPRKDASGASTRGGFDIILANPPYVRADEDFEDFSSSREEMYNKRAAWSAYRSAIKDSRLFESTREKWDLFVPFIERAKQLLRPYGIFAYIVSDGLNGNKYASALRKVLLRDTAILRLDFCSDLYIFDAGVRNTILIAQLGSDASENTPMRIRHYGDRPSQFIENAEVLPTVAQGVYGEALFREDSIPTVGKTEPQGNRLGDLTYISKGMVIHSDDGDHQGEFKAEDVLSDSQDAMHPYPFVFGKDLWRYRVRRLRYLEWGTTRAPSHFSRPSFDALQSGEKILTVRSPGETPKSWYDPGGVHFDASVVGFMRWCDLAGVENKGLAKGSRSLSASLGLTEAAKRIAAQELSEGYSYLYLLAVMNSGPVKTWIIRNRKAKRIHIYPDDWKELLIPTASAEAQEGLATLARQILDLKAGNPNADTTTLEAEIDKRVEFLYFYADEATTYDNWMETKASRAGQLADEVRAMIDAGESSGIEFKQSLEYVDPQHPDLLKIPESHRRQKLAETQKAIVHSALKTIVAFLNSRGGTLLFGVHDNKTVIGIEPDFTLCGDKPNLDGFELKLLGLLKSRVTPLPVDFEIRYAKLDGKTVAAVQVAPSITPHYLDSKLYIRLGNSTQELVGRDIEDWLRRRSLPVPMSVVLVHDLLDEDVSLEELS